jgi:hypothetical protein
MTDENKKKIGIIIAVIGAGAILAFGLSDYVNFWKAFSVLTYIEILGFGVYHFWKQSEYKTDTTFEQTLAEYETELGEQLTVIQEYEQIFDSQLVELPCICGGNTFQGLFSPKTDNIVQCEKCKCKYKVSIQYDTILISEPMDSNS